MGYESKLFVVNRIHFSERDGMPEWICAQEIASYDLSKMGYDAKEFFAAFKTEIDYKLWMPVCDDHGNETIGETDIDCYGEHMKGATLEDLIPALEAVEQRDRYRRLPPLIAMLKAFDPSEWDDLQVVHYGY